MVAPQPGQRKDLHCNLFMCAHMAQSHHLSSSAKEMRFPLLVCFAPELADISISQLEFLLGTRPDISEDVWFRDQYQDADVPLVTVGSIICGFIQYRTNPMQPSFASNPTACVFQLTTRRGWRLIAQPLTCPTIAPCVAKTSSMNGKVYLLTLPDVKECPPTARMLARSSGLLAA